MDLIGFGKAGVNQHARAVRIPIGKRSGANILILIHAAGNALGNVGEPVHDEIAGFTALGKSSSTSECEYETDGLDATEFHVIPPFSYFSERQNNSGQNYEGFSASTCFAPNSPAFNLSLERSDIVKRFERQVVFDRCGLKIHACSIPMNRHIAGLPRCSQNISWRLRKSGIHYAGSGIKL
jgi:hypothetical protein